MKDIETRVLTVIILIVIGFFIGTEHERRNIKSNPDACIPICEEHFEKMGC